MNHEFDDNLTNDRQSSEAESTGATEQTPDAAEPVNEYTPNDSYNASEPSEPTEEPVADEPQNPYSAPQPESYTPDAQASDGTSEEWRQNPYGQAYNDWQSDLNADPAAAAMAKPRRHRAALVAFLVVLIIVFAFTATTFAYLYFAGDGSPTQSETGAVNNGPDLTIKSKPANGEEVSTSANGKLSVTEIAKKVRPSVVGIVAYMANTSLETLGQTQASSGSGVIMSADGYIITNAHVVSGAARVAVVLDNEEEYEAKVIGADSKTDLAVVKINKNNLTAAEFGDSSQVEVGEDVIAIGNPSGLQLAGSLTRGIVSAVERQIQSSSSSYSMKCIQTDAAINPGNSGGALVNLYGQVVGINSSKIANVDYEGIGFAISSNEVKPVVDDLVKYGYVKGRAKIGITYQEISETYASMANVPAGLYVQSVEESADSYAQGLRAGDIITKIDGKAVTEVTVIDYLKTKKAGEKVKLTVYRISAMGNSTTLTMTITLAEDKGDTETTTQQSQTPNSRDNRDGWDSFFE